ncbi:hypothetical protein TM51_07891 [Thermobifida fusca TM51]|uniref:MFS transporter n=1 Tax=Thermobifida fusca TM51 TaxID=1169414 RepID=A0A9P2TBT8_THEFU|nr:MFS transporter [Thermobifida fusca]EOR71391.1 hypothetical protein TM51_07891 [Thermobifida fusca TM51]
MGIARETSGIGRFILGVFNAAAFAGLSTVVLPLLLDQRGATKPEIVIFYVLFALAAMAASLLGGGWCRRHGRYRTGIALGATLGLAGTAFLAAPTPGWAIYPAACGIAVGSLIYPSFVALLDNGTRSEARVMSLVRTVFIIGYIAGLGLASAMFLAEQTLGPLFHPIYGGMALYGLILLISVTLPAVAHPKPTTPEDPAARGRKKEWWLVALAVAAVFLLRGADNLRQVYLPLYALSAGIAESVIPSLFALTAFVEILVLVPLATAAERYGSVRTLVGVCVIGTLSFLLVAVGTGYGGLLTAQVLYAVFTAGFQSIAVVMLGQVTRAGVSGGIGAFVAIFHLGSVIGVTVPLVVPGYSAAIFWIGCGLCLLAAAAVVAVGGDLDPAHRETAKQPSPAAHRSVEKTVSAPDWHDGPATQ